MLQKFLTRITRSHTTDPSKLQSISAKPFFKHYTTAINLSLENKLKQSNQQFEKSLTEIKNSKENQLQHFSYIIRRIAHNFRRMGLMKQAEEKLYEAIKHKRESRVNSALLYDDYDLLFRHMISYDLEKAVKLCKAILLKEKQDMPISHVKLFNFNLGTAYLLSGNYNDSKSRLAKCLQADPQGKLKSYALNNLGLACWWHKNPIEKVREQFDGDETGKIEKDFQQVRDIFAKSIRVAEELSQDRTEIQKILLNQTLDFKKGNLNEKLELVSAPSLFPVYNLAKFYILNDPLQRFQILYWLKKSLQLSKSQKNPKFFDLTFTEYSILTNNIQPLLQKLPSLIQKYRYSQQFAEEAYYCSILGSLLRGRDAGKSEEVLARGRLIRSALPGWSGKIWFVAVDQVDLVN